VHNKVEVEAETGNGGGKGGNGGVAKAAAWWRWRPSRSGCWAKSDFWRVILVGTVAELKFFQSKFLVSFKH
jgi:hypothetical protein